MLTKNVGPSRTRYHFSPEDIPFSTQYDRIASDTAYETARLEKHWRLD
jgi:hypothetical protein